MVKQNKSSALEWEQFLSSKPESIVDDMKIQILSSEKLKNLSVEIKVSQTKFLKESSEIWTIKQNIEIVILQIIKKLTSFFTEK